MLRFFWAKAGELGPEAVTSGSVNGNMRLSGRSSSSNATLSVRGETVPKLLRQKSHHHHVAEVYRF